MNQSPPEEASLGLGVDEETTPRPAPRHARPDRTEDREHAQPDGRQPDEPQPDEPQPDHLVSPDDPEDPARSPRTLGIDNTDTALGAEDDSAPVE